MLNTSVLRGHVIFGNEAESQKHMIENSRHTGLQGWRDTSPGLDRNAVHCRYLEICGERFH